MSNDKSSITKNQSATTNRQSLIVLALTLIAFILRVYRLDFQSLWIDEGLTLRYAHLSFSELLATLRSVRAVPPLYHVLTIYWVQWLGDSDFSLRFLSTFFSVLVIPLTYRLGKSLLGSRIALFAAVLVTVSPFQIWHAQDARNYSMLTASAVFSLWSFVSLWKYGGWQWWMLYIFSTEWTIMTHYHGLIIIGVQGLFLLLRFRRYRRRYVEWGASLAIILLPYAAWMLVGSRAWQGTHWLPRVGLLASYWQSAIAYSIGEMVPSIQQWLPALVFLVAFTFGLLFLLVDARRSSRAVDKFVLLAVFVFAPNFAVWLYSQLKTPVYLPRYLIPVQIGFLLTVAVGIDALAGRGTFRSPRRWLATAAGVLLMGISVWVLVHHYTDPLYAKPNWRGVAQTIETFQLPDDGILMTGTGGEFLFDHYYHGGLTVRHDFNTPAPSPPEAETIIANIAAENARLWFTPYGEPLDPLLEKWLAENAFPAWQKWVGRKNLLLYRTGNPALTRQETVNATFGAAVLDTISLPDDAIAAGDLLPLKSVWHANAPISADVKISLRLMNPAGDIFAQSDFPPFAVSPSVWETDTPQTDRRALWIPADTPPGLYDVRLVVYDGATGQPLGDAVTIAAVPVSAATLTPPAEALNVPRNRDVPLGAVSLVGAIAPQTVAPGEFLWLWLFFRADEATPPDTPLQFTVTDGSRTETIPLTLQAVAGDTENWRVGQIRRTIVHLPTGADFTGDTVTVRVSAGNTAPQTLAVVGLRK